MKSIKKFRRFLSRSNTQVVEEWYLKIRNNKNIKNERLRQYLLQKVFCDYLPTVKFAYLDLTYNSDLADVIKNQ